MAPRLTQLELIFLLGELLGTYAIAPDLDAGMFNRRVPLTSPELVQAHLEQLGPAPGAAQVRSALAQACVRSNSPYETRLSMRFGLRPGLGGWHLNVLSMNEPLEVRRIVARLGTGVRKPDVFLGSTREDTPFSALDNSPAANAELARQMDALADGRRVPTVDPRAGELMVDAVMATRAEKDTLGGIVECVATGLPAGTGSPMFDGMENVLARDLFGIPSVKGVEFGRGFAAARLRGTQNNDAYEVRDGACVPRTNNAGGILGGITTGAPLLVRCAFKPISSVMVEQDSVDLNTMEPARLEVRGRHDTTAVIRAVPVVEAVCALGIADALLAWPAE